MEIRINGKDIQVTEGISQYIERKLERIEKYFDNVEADITIKSDKNVQIAEFFITSNGEKFRAEAEEKDLYASIDKVIDILEGQIRKAKTKKEKMMKEASLKDFSNIDKKDVEIQNEILKVAYYEAKPMTAEDAMLKLQEVPTHIFLPFIDVGTGKVNVIYKLKDGKNYGIVEPEA